MLFQNLALIYALAALVAAQDIDQDDIPQQCTAVCAEVVSIAQRCDAENGKTFVYAKDSNLPLP